MTAQVTTPQETVERALARSRADDCVVIAEEFTTANLRWANNTLTTNGVAQGRELTVIATVRGRTGTAAGVVTRSGGIEDDEALERLVRTAEGVARDTVNAEDAMPLVEAAEPEGGPVGRWDDAVAATSIGVFSSFAPGLGDAFSRAARQDRLLYGFAEHELRSTFLGSSTGLRRRHDQPTGHVELNARSADQRRSAWVGVPATSFAELDVAGMDATLTRRLGWAERQVELPAGRYDTVVPPSAVADLMIDLYWSASARDAHDGRSVFGRPGGTRVGERLTDAKVTLRSDPSESGLACAPFVIAHGSGPTQSVFDNGLAAAPTRWITDGVLTSLIHTRHSGALTGLPVTPAIDNLIMEGSGAGRAMTEIVADVDDGLLLTCLWYIREVDPRTLLLTGLTRDGVYAIRHGEVIGAVNNFRFNESPVDLLGRLSEVGVTERTLAREWGDAFTRTAMPAVRIPDFNMSSVSQAS